MQYLKFGWWYSNQTWTVSSSMGYSHFIDIPCPWGWGERVLNVGLKDFCHIWTLLSPGASVFDKHMSSWQIRLARDRPRSDRPKKTHPVEVHFIHITSRWKKFLSANLLCWKSRNSLVHQYLPKPSPMPVEDGQNILSFSKHFYDRHWLHTNEILQRCMKIWYWITL